MSSESLNWPPYLGTVEGILQLVCQLLLLLPGRLDQAGVDEGESLHDLLHGKARPGGLLLSLGRAEHLIRKKVKYHRNQENSVNQRKSFLRPIIASFIESWIDTAQKEKSKYILNKIRRTFYIYILYMAVLVIISLWASIEVITIVNWNRNAGLNWIEIDYLTYKDFLHNFF